MEESDKQAAPENEAALGDEPAKESENSGEKPASNGGQPSAKKERSSKKGRKEKNKSASQPQVAPAESPAEEQADEASEKQAFAPEEKTVAETATETPEPAQEKTPESAAAPTENKAEPASSEAPHATPDSTPPATEVKAPAATAPPPPEAPFPPPAPKNKALRGSPFLGIIFGTIGIFTVCGLGLLIFVPENIPYVLTGVDSALDSKIRYQTTNSVAVKDWHKDLQDEQIMWTNEISKIKLGTSGAKPLASKRDFLLFLADAYYRDQPHYMEAKAAYMAAMQEPKLPHEHAYEITDGELHQRIGFCALRMRFYNEAEEQLQQALACAEAITDPKLKLQHDAGITLALDSLTECYIREGKLDKAEALLKRRLESIQQTNPKNSIEVSLLFNFALLREAQGNLKEAEEFFNLALANNENEDRQRGVVKDSPNDNSRKKAYILREYARLLRKEHRPDEAIALMQRAIFLSSNAP